MKSQHQAHVTAQCLSTLGPVDLTYNTSRFENSSIVVENAVVLIDDAIISSSNFLQISEDVIGAEDVWIVFIDTVLDEKVDLIFPEFCHIDCHQIVGGNMSLIRQLVAHCTASYNQSDPVKLLQDFSRIWTNNLLVTTLSSF